jgi:hypothetical protein
MSGADIPYHLRPNKYVERQLGMDLLDKLRGWNPDVEGYVYISMGSRFMEDFRQLHARFGLKNMASIESDPVVCQRQEFNRPVSLIKCWPEKSVDFVTNFDTFTQSYPPNANYFVWLDYTDAKHRQSQLREYQDLVSKLAANDVIKITLNASLHTLAKIEGSESTETFQRDALTRLKEKLQDMFPDELAADPSEMTAPGLAKLLARAVKRAALKGIAGNSNLHIVPLCSFSYSDGNHQMLTVTAIILDQPSVAAFEACSVARWEFRAAAWDDVQPISIPDLSIKERLRIEEGLFTQSDEELHASLPFRFDGDNNVSLRALRSYIQHYRRYPSFQRIAY